MNLVADWIDFCEDRRTFSDGHFTMFLTDDLTDQELKWIFSYFPNSDLLYSRLKEFKLRKSQMAEYKAGPNELESLLAKDIKLREKFFKALPQNRIDLSNHSLKYTDDAKFFERLMWDDVWSQSFYDFVSGMIHEAKLYVLKDAFYGVTYNFDLQLYLFQPLVDLDYDMTPLFDFTMKGGQYAITKTEVWFTNK